MTSYANTRLAILLICIASILLPIVVLAALPNRLREMRDNYDDDFHVFYAPVAKNLLDGKGLVTPKGEFASAPPPRIPAPPGGRLRLGAGARRR